MNSGKNTLKKQYSGLFLASYLSHSKKMKIMLSMKSIRNAAFTALLTIGAFSAITYTSCNKDECKDVVCQNGGTCVSGTCTCPTGYEGTNCEILSRDKFVGKYVGTEICTIGTDSYTMELSKNSDNLKITLTNLYNQQFTAICNMTSKTTFSFSGSQGSATFSGTGELTGTSNLKVTYTITTGVTTNSCTFNGTK